MRSVERADAATVEGRAVNCLSAAASEAVTTAEVLRSECRQEPTSVTHTARTETMKSLVTASLVALLAFAGASGLLESSASAQGKTKSKAKAQGTAVVVEPAAPVPQFEIRGDVGPVFERPYYLIQVEYARVAPTHHGGYGGRQEGRPKYTYAWITIAESTDLEEAEFIYALFDLAWQQGVLHEVAPEVPYFDYPRRVRMITEYREYEPVLSAD